MPSTASAPLTSSATPTNAAPRRSDTTGPAMAMRNSAAAEGNIPLKRATPPKSQSVMPSISIPSRCACTAWPSSCRRMEAKNRSVAATAMAR